MGFGILRMSWIPSAFIECSLRCLWALAFLECFWLFLNFINKYLEWFLTCLGFLYLDGTFWFCDLNPNSSLTISMRMLKRALCASSHFKTSPLTSKRHRTMHASHLLCVAKINKSFQNEPSVLKAPGLLFVSLSPLLLSRTACSVQVTWSKRARPLCSLQNELDRAKALFSNTSKRAQLSIFKPTKNELKFLRSTTLQMLYCIPQPGSLADSMMKKMFWNYISNAFFECLRMVWL